MILITDTQSLFAPKILVSVAFRDVPKPMGSNKARLERRQAVRHHNHCRWSLAIAVTPAYDVSHDEEEDREHC